MNDSDTRRQSRELVGGYQFSVLRSLILCTASFVIAGVVAYLPNYSGLEEAGQTALFILIAAAAMWITEAIPAFATSLLVIGMELALLGKPGGTFAETSKDYEMFLAPWGSPLIWLFFGGFVMAAAAEKTGLDRWMTSVTLGKFGRRPAMLVLGTMLVTATLSMFMSNTATATLMLTALTPLAASRPKGDSLTRALMVSVAFAANVGGMGTVIGTPPNAIAAGALSNVKSINFAEWMVLAVPSVAVLLVLAWVWILVRYLRGIAWQKLENLELGAAEHPQPPKLQQAIVVVTFTLTIGLWLTGPLHNIPTTVISFLPICVLTATGIMAADDIRHIPWDVLLLIAGGLSLGVAISETSLASWLVGQLPIEDIGVSTMVVAFGFITVVLSNLMSNTAASNIVVPIVVAIILAKEGHPWLVVPVALAASCAMCLPISTPPNAIVYSSRRITTADLLFGGLFMAMVGPIIAAAWAMLALTWFG